MQTNLNTSVTTAIFPPSIMGSGSFASRIWISVFPLVSVAIFIAQPTAMTTLVLAVSLSLAMAAIAHLSVRDENGFEAKLAYVRILAPVQSALLMWLAVYLGRDLAGVSLLATSLAAFVALGGILVIDALFSSAALLAAERGRGAMGTSIACLISEKYAGLLGKID